MVSAIILTKNEEKNIKDCLKCVAWCDEILVIDEGSTDGTCRIVKTIKNEPIKLFERRIEGDFAGQRNFGLERAKGEWVLFLDADERITPALRNEVIKLLGGDVIDCNGFYIKRIDNVWGRELKYGEATIKLLRLARKDKGEWRRRVHEVWEVEGQIKQLKNPIIHYPHKNLSEFIQKVDFYSTLDAKQKFRDGTRSSLFKVIFYPFAKLFLNYVIKKGYKDGVSGMLHASVMAFHSYLSWSKLWLIQK